MASFVTNLFSSSNAGRDKSAMTVDTSYPSTPVKNDFLTPADTPHGSPSKKVVPPGAHELPTSLDSMRLDGGILAAGASLFGSPVKLGRPQSTVITPLAGAGKTNILPATDDQTPSPAASVDDSVVHKSAPGSPRKKQDQENTPPQQPQQPPRLDQSMYLHNHAAVSRQELYQVKDKATASAKKFNTSRGLTPEELEILNKPNVKRMVNVTQLCKCGLGTEFLAHLLIDLRLPRLLL